MNLYGPAITNLTEQFAKLPGVGKKSAERLMHHILRSSREEALALADAIRRVKDTVHPCPNCFNLTEGEVCNICNDSRRDPTLLCIV